MCTVVPENADGLWGLLCLQAGLGNCGSFSIVEFPYGGFGFWNEPALGTAVVLPIAVIVYFYSKLHSC